MIFQKSDPIRDALKATSALEVAHFFSIYDLHITEQQKIRFLSLTSTTGKYLSSVQQIISLLYLLCTVIIQEYYI